MTEEQKKHISENSKKIANDGRYTIYVYDIKEEREYSFTTCQSAAEYFSLTRECIYSALKRRGICNKRLIISKDSNSLKELILSYKQKILNKQSLNSGTFKYKYSIEEYVKLKEKYSSLSAEELAKAIGVCKKTIYNYESQIPNPTFKQKEETKYKIINIQTLEEFTVNAKEGGELFNLSDGQFRKTEKYCRDHSSIYKKKYKIIRLNNL